MQITHLRYEQPIHWRNFFISDYKISALLALSLLSSPIALPAGILAELERLGENECFKACFKKEHSHSEQSRQVLLDQSIEE